MRAKEFDTPAFYHGSEFKFDQFKSTSGAYWFTDDLRSARSQGPHVISARLTLKNPYHWKEGDPEPDLPNFLNYLISRGHDGVIAPSNISLGNDYIVFDPKQIKIIGSKTFSRDEEQLDELKFLGSQCTKDCSGHRAGYAWSRRKGTVPNSRSPSFNKGAALQAAGK